MLVTLEVSLVGWRETYAELDSMSHRPWFEIRNQVARLLSLGLLLLIPATLGCEPPPVELVDAPVLVKNANGEPVENAMVLAVPVRLRSDLGWDLPYAHGRTNAEGIAHLTSEAGLRGLLSGRYEIWVIERSEITSIQGSPSFTDVTYSKHRVEVGSRWATPRLELKHDRVRVLKDVEVAQGSWASMWEDSAAPVPADEPERGGP